MSKKHQTAVITEGRVEFSNVHFSYPTRSSILVLRGISFSVSPGEKLAIVGASGSGKTSIVQLLLRHYEQHLGAVSQMFLSSLQFYTFQIKIDGSELSDFDLNYLRQKIAIVQQEPVLFSGTIEEVRL